MDPTVSLDTPDAFTEEADGAQLAGPQDPEGPKAVNMADAAEPQAATAGTGAADRLPVEEPALVSVACDEAANAAEPQAARAGPGRVDGSELKEAAAAFAGPAEAASADTAKTLAAGACPTPADEPGHEQADAPVPCADLRHATGAGQPRAIAAKPEPEREPAASCVAPIESAHEAARLQTQAVLAASDSVEEVETGKAAPAIVCPEAALEANTMEPQALPDSTEAADAPEAGEPSAPVAHSDMAQDVDMLEAHDVDMPNLQAMPACAALADEAPKPAQPQSAPLMSADMPLKEAVAAEQLALAAEKHSILWARVKGFPHWPVCLFSLSVTVANVLRPDPHIVAKGMIGLQSSQQDSADSTWRVKEIGSRTTWP